MGHVDVHFMPVIVLLMGLIQSLLCFLKLLPHTKLGGQGTFYQARHSSKEVLYGKELCCASHCLFQVSFPVRLTEALDIMARTEHYPNLSRLAREY